MMQLGKSKIYLGFYTIIRMGYSEHFSNIVLLTLDNRMHNHV